MENGVLLSGIVCKKTLGASSGSLCHVVALEKSPEVCREFYSNIQVSFGQKLKGNLVWLGVCLRVNVDYATVLYDNIEGIDVICD